MKKLLTIAALLAISICHGAQEDVVRTTKATGVVVNPALVNFPTGTLEVNGVAVTGGGALTSGTLAQFSATTSAEFAGVISDETGTGAVVLANSPVFITPTLGTVTSGNVDAILPASSLTVSGIIELATQGEVDTGADAVRAITPATLAGATDVIGIAHLSATGTPNGTTFLRGDNTWSAPAGAGDLLAANNLSDVANAPTSLSNLGGIGAATSDTLTNKSFNANDTGNVLTNVDVADLAGGTDGELITWDAAGVATTVAVGTAGQVLISAGPGSPPAFGAAGAGDLLAANNLSDVANASTSLSNLGGIGASTSDSLTNKTFNANGTGNSLSNVDVADLADATDGELITWSAAGVATTVSVGTVGQVLKSNGAGAAPSFQAGGGGGGWSGTFREIWIPAAAFTPASTAAPAAGTISIANNEIDFWAFDDTTIEIVFTQLSLPDAWDLGNIKARVYWAADSTTNDVLWEVVGTAFSDATTLTTLATGASILDAAQGTTDQLSISGATAGFQPIGAGAAALNDMLTLRVSRTANDVTDDMTGDSRFYGVKIQYLENSTEPVIW